MKYVLKVFFILSGFAAMAQICFTESNSVNKSLNAKTKTSIPKDSKGPNDPGI